MVSLRALCGWCSLQDALLSLVLFKNKGHGRLMLTRLFRRLSRQLEMVELPRRPPSILLYRHLALLRPLGLALFQQIRIPTIQQQSPQLLLL